MKLKILTVLVFLLSFSAQSQYMKMKVTLTNGQEQTGEYRIKKRGTNSSNTYLQTKDGRKLMLQDFNRLVIYKDTLSVNYEVIEAKDNLKDKKADKKLGQVIFTGARMEVFAVAEVIWSGGGMSPSASEASEKYVRRIGDSIAYNMGEIYGASARSIKKRMNDYFTDCPLLIIQIERDSLDRHNIIDVAKFYEKNCK